MSVRNLHPMLWGLVQGENDTVAVQLRVPTRHAKQLVNARLRRLGGYIRYKLSEEGVVTTRTGNTFLPRAEADILASHLEFLKPGGLNRTTGGLPAGFPRQFTVEGTIDDMMGRRNPVIIEIAPERRSGRPSVVILRYRGWLRDEEIIDNASRLLERERRVTATKLQSIARGRVTRRQYMSWRQWYRFARAYRHQRMLMITRSRFAGIIEGCDRAKEDLGRLKSFIQQRTQAQRRIKTWWLNGRIQTLAHGDLARLNLRETQAQDVLDSRQKFRVERKRIYAGYFAAQEEVDQQYRMGKERIEREIAELLNKIDALNLESDDLDKQKQEHMEMCLGKYHHDLESSNQQYLSDIKKIATRPYKACGICCSEAGTFVKCSNKQCNYDMCTRCYERAFREAESENRLAPIGCIGCGRMLVHPEPEKRSEQLQLLQSMTEGLMARIQPELIAQLVPPTAGGLLIDPKSYLSGSRFAETFSLKDIELAYATDGTESYHAMMKSIRNRWIFRYYSRAGGWYLGRIVNACVESNAILIQFLDGDRKEQILSGICTDEECGCCGRYYLPTIWWMNNDRVDDESVQRQYAMLAEMMRQRQFITKPCCESDCKGWAYERPLKGACARGEDPRELCCIKHQQIQAERELEEFKKKREVQKCPSCDAQGEETWMERYDGCNWVRCRRCSKPMCWLCGDVLEDSDHDQERKGNSWFATSLHFRIGNKEQGDPEDVCRLFGWKPCRGLLEGSGDGKVA